MFDDGDGVAALHANDWFRQTARNIINGRE